jgi:hypothetical protein
MIIPPNIRSMINLRIGAHDGLRWPPSIQVVLLFFVLLALSCASQASVVGDAAIDAGDQPQGGSSACYPTCYTDLVASCDPEGTCKTAIIDNKQVDCYENGISVMTMNTYPEGSWRYSRDGAVCLSGQIMDVELDPYEEDLFDGSGTLRVQVFAWQDNTRLEIVCDGQTYPIDLTATACLSSPVVSTPCQPGVCP